ncbi:hypothetical protein LIER_18256 [Lithospermum erythrorhizon]|uniref:Uncharacterized protein n=1 Tax=Lithospermum erythrorhizon TaxID=34254 RepID=A0AAV3QGH1_LITER
MASKQTNHIAYGLTIYLSFLIFLQQFDLAVATRASKLLHPSPALHVPSCLIKVFDPPFTRSIAFNRYKKMEADGYRPTNPGHSPGMGHEDPPGSH